MEHILDILSIIPNPWVILPVASVVFVVPGLIVGFCFKSVRRVEVVYTWTFTCPVIETLIAALIIHLFVSPFDIIPVFFYNKTKRAKLIRQY
jgi:hypothetical protein